MNRVSTVTGLVAIAGCAVTATASDQSEGFDGFLPFIKPLRLGATVSTDYEPEADTVDGTGRYARTNASLSARTQLYRSDTDEVTMNGLGAESLIDSDLILPDGRELPAHLYRIQGGLAYRHLYQGGYAVGLSGSIGSASDRPFDSTRETSVGATLFTRLPANGQDAWLLFLNYANDRPLLNNVPLPGVGYLWVKDQTWLAFIGLPFAFVTWRPNRWWEADVALSGLGSAHAGVAVKPITNADWLRFRIAYDWRPETYKPVDRPITDDQLIFREMRLTAGVGCDTGPTFSANCYAGYAFHREIFIDDSISGSHDDRVWVAPGWVLGASLKTRF